MKCQLYTHFENLNKVCLRYSLVRSDSFGIEILTRLQNLQGMKHVLYVCFLDTVVCYIVNCQVLYLFSVSISIHGLVLLAGERFIAVCKPFQYIYVKNSRCVPALAFLCIYTFAFAACLPYVLVCSFRNGTCIADVSPEFYNNHIFKSDIFKQYFLRIFPYVWFLSYYIVPVVAVCILYSLVVNALRRSMYFTGNSGNKIVQDAATEITKTGLTVTILFLLFVGVDMINYMLEYSGVIDYDLTIKTIGLFFTTLNSVVNPFIYVLIMPMFRKSLHKKVCCLLRKGPDFNH